MLVQFVEGDRDKALRKLYAFGVDLEVAEDTTWEVTREGPALRVTNVAEDPEILTTFPVAVRRNAVLVVVNPKLGEAVGYQPAAPQILFPGYWGGVDVKFRSPEDATRAWEHLGRDWGVRLCLVQVGAPGRD